MAINITTVFIFEIEIDFDKWLSFFDSKDSNERLSEFDIKPLFRGQCKKDPKRVIVIHQSPEGNMQKFFKKYGSWIATHGVKISTIEISDWL